MYTHISAYPDRYILIDIYSKICLLAEWHRGGATQLQNAPERGDEGGLLHQCSPKGGKDIYFPSAIYTFIMPYISHIQKEREREREREREGGGRETRVDWLDLLDE